MMGTGESGGIHAVPPHQIPFLFRARRFVGRPQLVQFPEVRVHGRRVEYEEANGRVSAMPKV